MIRGLHHVAISVRDLDRSMRFYRDVLGMECAGDNHFEGGAMDHITALGTTRGRSAMLRSGELRLELFEFAQPTPRTMDPLRPVCDHGISHFCIEVSDLQLEYERLASQGVKFHCPPQSFGKAIATYARDPDGNVFELLEMA